MIKAFLILAAIMGVLSFVYIVATASSGDKDSYEAYQRWKERKKHGKMD